MRIKYLLNPSHVILLTFWLQKYVEQLKGTVLEHLNTLEDRSCTWSDDTRRTLHKIHGSRTGCMAVIFGIVFVPQVVPGGL